MRNPIRNSAHSQTEQVEEQVQGPVQAVAPTPWLSDLSATSSWARESRTLQGRHGQICGIMNCVWGGCDLGPMAVIVTVQNSS